MGASYIYIYDISRLRVNHLANQRSIKIIFSVSTDDVNTNTIYYLKHDFIAHCRIISVLFESKHFALPGFVEAT